MNVPFFRLFNLRPSPDHSFRVSLEWPALLDLVPDLRPPEEETTSRTFLDSTAHINLELSSRLGVFTLLFEGLTLSRFVAAFKTFIYTNYKNVRPFF